MPDLDLIKQAEQGLRDRRGQFSRGHSGNPAGRPKACRDHANRAVQALLAEAGEALVQKAVELALAGDPAALRLCLERLAEPWADTGTSTGRLMLAVLGGPRPRGARANPHLHLRRRRAGNQTRPAYGSPAATDHGAEGRGPLLFDTCPRPWQTNSR
jgi:Family of unknown function (DUF5681)